MKMMNNIEFDELSEFKKDLKNLLKKYRTLVDDLEVVRLDLNDESGESPPFSFRIDNLGIETCIIKVKKIACKALNPHYALENLFRAKIALNQKLRTLFFCNHSGAMIFESKCLIFCTLDSHYDS